MKQKTPQDGIYIKITENGPYLVCGKPLIKQEYIAQNEDGDNVDFADQAEQQRKAKYADNRVHCRASQRRRRRFRNFQNGGQKLLFQRRRVVHAASPLIWQFHR